MLKTDAKLKSLPPSLRHLGSRPPSSYYYFLILHPHLHLQPPTLCRHTRTGIPSQTLQLHPLRNGLIHNPLMPRGSTPPPPSVLTPTPARQSLPSSSSSSSQLIMRWHSKSRLLLPLPTSRGDRPSGGGELPDLPADRAHGDELQWSRAAERQGRWLVRGAEGAEQ